MALYGNSSSSSPAASGHFTPPSGQFGPSGAVGASPINARGAGAYGGFGGAPGVGVPMSGPPGMMASPAIPYNVHAAMTAQHQQNQQLHLQQVQQQLASLKMHGAGADTNGATLSNNLWQ